MSHIALTIAFGQISNFKGELKKKINVGNNFDKFIYK